MTPPSNPLADRVWQQTLPALRHRRRIRRAAKVTGSAAALLLALLTLHGLPSNSAAEQPSTITAVLPSPPPASGDSSLAILVIGQSGARFEQRRPDEIADQDLSFNLSLDPVITIAMLE